MLFQLLLFLLVALLLGLMPIFAGARILKIGNPSFFAAAVALAGVLALHDLVFLFFPEQSWAWIVSAAAGAFVVSLMLDTPLWKAFVISGSILLVMVAATDGLLHGTPPMEHLTELVKGTQKELWPAYN